MADKDDDDDDDDDREDVNFIITETLARSMLAHHPSRQLGGMLSSSRDKLPRLPPLASQALAPPKP